MSVMIDDDFGDESFQDDKDLVTECEICGDSCDFIPFPCRDEDTGYLAEIIGCCVKCHDQWCLCNCKRPYNPTKSSAEAQP